jgi:hypothetical protein
MVPAKEREMFKRIFRIALAGLAMGFLAGCGGGSGGTQLSPGSASVQVALTVTDSASNAATNHIAYGNPVTVQAIVTDKSGKAASDAIVTFAVDDAAAVELSQTKVLTDSSGKAWIRVSANKINKDTAIVVTASASVSTKTTTGTTTATASSTANLSVGQTTTGAPQGTPALLQYVSATPTRMVIKGASAGSGSLSETSVVSFKVLDSLGTIVTGAQVTFDLTSRNGGIQTNGSDSAVTVTSDSGGIAKVTIQSGTLPESFLVYGTLPGSAAPTQKYYSNDQLAISSNFPDQTHFSLMWDPSASCGKGGELTYPCTLNVFVGDYLGHPVPDGTIVTFVTSQQGLVVGTTDSGGSATGYCKTSAGQCTAKVWGDGWTRNEVVAYAKGQNAPASTPIIVHNYSANNWGGATAITVIASPDSDQYIRESIMW